MIAQSRLAGAVAAYLDRRVLAIFFLGISSGFPLTLVLATLTYWLSKEGVSKGEVGLFASLLTPYALKFTWAPLIDRLSIPGLARWVGQRRTWLLVSQVALIASVIALGTGDPKTELGFMAIAAFFVALSSATQDIVIDAYRIEILDEEDQGHGAAMINFGYRTGNLIAGAGAVALQIVVGWQMTYGLMSLLVLFGAGAALVIGEPRRHDVEGAREQEAVAEAWLGRHGHLPKALAKALSWLYATVVVPFSEFLTRPLALLILFFIVIYKWGDAMGQVMLAPLIVDLGFSDAEYIWANKVVGFAALLAGTALGAPVVKMFGMFRALMITGVLMMVTNLLFAGLALIGNEAWALGVAVGFENFASGVGLTVFVAYLSGLCNLAYTATHYALLSSLAVAARTWMSAPSGFLVEGVGWPIFYVITTVAAIPGLVILVVLWRRGFRVVEPERDADSPPATP